MRSITKPTRIETVTEREALKITGNIKKRFQGMSGAWFDLGKMVRDALDRQVPEVLEMNAHDWMVSVFGEVASVAKIQRSLRIARALEKLPEERIRCLSEGKAYMLTQLKEEDREEYLGTALNVSNDEFEEMVETKREEYGFKREKKARIEGLTVEQSLAEQWEAAEKKVARLLNLDLELKPGLRAQVLEAIAALINTTPDEVLMPEITGEEAA